MIKDIKIYNLKIKKIKMQLNNLMIIIRMIKMKMFMI